MKQLPFVLLSCYAGLCLASPEVGVHLRSFRIEMSPHGLSASPALSMTLAFSPPKGFELCETSELPGALYVTDARGIAHPCAPAILTKEGQQDSPTAIAEFNLAARPKGDEVKVSGNLSLTMAAGKTRHEQVEVSLLQPGTFSLDGIRFQVEPDAANNDKKNREGRMLRHASLLLRYPKEVDILHIDRIWQASTPEADSEAAGYAQGLSFKTHLSADGHERLTRIELWDARVSETLQITTCKEQKQIPVPVQFSLRIGGIAESPPAP